MIIMALLTDSVVVVEEMRTSSLSLVTGKRYSLHRAYQQALVVSESVADYFL